MTSLLGMLWSAEDTKMALAAKHRLRCFALDQVGYLFWDSMTLCCWLNRLLYDWHNTSNKQ
jgi:hypothetical protein